MYLSLVIIVSYIIHSVNSMMIKNNVAYNIIMNSYC